MSYILDALKNSQDSRSRGAVPDLASQMAAARPGPTRSERIWRMVALATVLLLLAVLAVLGWQRWLAPPVVDPQLAPPLAEQSAPVAAPPGTAPTAAPQTAVQPPAATATESVASTAQAGAPGLPSAAPEPAAPALAQAAAPVESQAPGLAALQQLAGVRVSVDEPKPASPPTPAAAPDGPPPIVQKLELPVERPPVAAPAPKPQPLVPALSVPQAVPAPGPQLAEYGAVEHWKQLPAQVQQQLREMPFNVHIYARDPKLRFVKTGGRTLREGDAINAELKVLHITRDGMIVGYKGGKYWMRLS
ncbi:general secretion pathway protein GspB [Pseudomonas oryzae]|uniref:Type II secretion system protein B n=1 Tax=Pseudomonas oryzae TaxID=1392877 RepID=A0A1H1RU41_9PSED|nr:general secretion pathway protein GspB [Pseudomonas oryzae]SDS39200.1 Type II secretion system protein B [Pseudomonas oryzae]